jgi:hypothetical protein
MPNPSVGIDPTGVDSLWNLSNRSEVLAKSNIPYITGEQANPHFPALPIRNATFSLLTATKVSRRIRGFGPFVTVVDLTFSFFCQSWISSENDTSLLSFSNSPVDNVSIGPCTR